MSDVYGSKGARYASHDTLTGLGDKDSFSRKLTHIISDKSAETSIFTLIIVDIDHFKSVNDGFGHSRGDRILSEFGSRVLDVSREEDMMFRYGGDEFTGILPGADSDEAVRFSKRLLEKVTGTEFKGDPPLFITLSVGIAQYPIDGLSARELFDTADRRLYVAKRTGRNKIIAVDDSEQSDNFNSNEVRLLGREKELSSFMLFSEDAGDKGRGFFLVFGPDGAGKGFFLDAVASLLSLSDYKLLEVSGTRADIQAPHSSMAAALLCNPDRDSVIESLYSHAGVSMCLGIFLKDMHLMDSESIEDLLKFYSIYPGWMIVAASTERNLLSQSSSFGGVSASIRLGSISQEDCRAWFRSVLLWDPPEYFLEWFHSETDGLPGLFAPGIRHLERRGYLISKSGNYRIEGDCMNFPLGNRLAVGSTAEINNLPVDLTPFLGREKELGVIRELMKSGVRLLTLKGMSGMGCSRLAIRAASQNDSMFSTGICLIDCESCDNTLPLRLASELSLPSGRDAEISINSFLTDAEMLLVLLNVSSGDETVPFISRLIQTCNELTILVTSRVPLNVNGEAIVTVNGVSTERVSNEIPSDAASIFIQAAERLAGIRFSGDLNLKVVEDICVLLNGAPLAIELAASWVRVMSVSSISKRIRANPSFLGGTDKEKTTDGLADLFHQSWEQLSPVERNAACRLTVFAGHFTVEEAEEISDVPPEMIMSLVDRSFLLRDDQGIHIPALTSDFIVQELNPSSRGFEVAREMHCRFFASQAEKYGEMALTGREAGKGLDGIKTSFGDISLAWKLAIENGRYRFLRQMLNPLSIYCLDRGRFRTGFHMMEEAVSYSANEVPDGLRSAILSNQSLLAFRMGRARIAKQLIHEALSLTTDSTDSDRAIALFTKGRMMVDQGKLSASGDFLKDALIIFSKENKAIEALEVELEIMKCELLSGNYNHVRLIIPSIAERCRKHSFRTGEWKTRLYMGNLAAADGDYRRAREAFLGYLSAVKTAGYTGLCAMALNEVAGVEANQGSFGEAEQHYLAAAEYFKRIGSAQGQAGIKLNLAIVNQMRGKTSEVKKNYAEALELGEIVHDEKIIANSLCGLAFNCIETKELEKADSFLKRAAGIANRSGNKPVLIRALYGLGVLDSMSGNLVRAAVTALTLLHNPAADSEAEGFCMELIGTLKVDLGAEKMEELKQGTESITIQELMDMHSVTNEQYEDLSYRTS